MSDNELFRKYIDIINEGPEQIQNVQRSRDAAKWAKENPDSAEAFKTGLNVVTDFIPGVSQVNHQMQFFHQMLNFLQQIQRFQQAVQYEFLPNLHRQLLLGKLVQQ